jgi:hypothetical protein
MGKKETKPGSPKSANKAADIVRNAGAGGFAFVPPGTQSFQVPSSEEYENISSEMRVILKGLAKKDPTTRVRALDELFQYCQKDEADLTGFIPSWVCRI